MNQSYYPHVESVMSHIYGSVMSHTLTPRWCCSYTIQHNYTHTATCCNTLQHAATRCHTLQHAATHCNALQHASTHNVGRMTLCLLCHTHINESCHTYVNESCHTHLKQSSHTHMNESCPTYERAMSHTLRWSAWQCEFHVTTYKSITSHIWMSHVTHLDPRDMWV